MDKKEAIEKLRAHVKVDTPIRCIFRRGTPSGAAQWWTFYLFTDQDTLRLDSWIATALDLRMDRACDAVRIGNPGYSVRHYVTERLHSEVLGFLPRSEEI